MGDTGLEENIIFKQILKKNCEKADIWSSSVSSGLL
jgi:hypothetical protein